MVGARGFEPPTSCSQSRRATRLRYAPIPISNDQDSYHFRTRKARDFMAGGGFF